MRARCTSAGPAVGRHEHVTRDAHKVGGVDRKKQRRDQADRVLLGINALLRIVGVVGSHHQPDSLSSQVRRLPVLGGFQSLVLASDEPPLNRDHTRAVDINTLPQGEDVSVVKGTGRHTRWRTHRALPCRLSHLKSEEKCQEAKDVRVMV